MHVTNCGGCTQINKLKSLKVAQVKDEMDDDEDDSCEGVCDVTWLRCAVMLCCDGVCVMLRVMVCVMV